MSAVPVYTPTPEEEEAFQQALIQASATEAKVPAIMIDGRPVAWYPLQGSQTMFMQCPLLECLFHGTRGPGKTDALIMSFAQYVGRGYGAAWRGIIFRQTYPQLADVQAKTEKWFRQIFPTAKFNKAKMMWEWPTGEVLLLRHMNNPSDYWNYHGHEYPFIGWEELCNWSTDQCFKAMFSCCRSSTPGIPRMIRATTNPYGPGHNWVKLRYRLHGKWWEPIVINDAKSEIGQLEPPRAAIHGNINENHILLAADPNYKQTIIASASNKAMGEAWLYGSWDIVAGGMFGDVWVARFNIVKRFLIPDGWRLDRSFDWGSSHPFSVGWWAESDGSDYRGADGQWHSTVRGDLFRFAEWYGWTGKPDEGVQMLATDIARGIVEREIAWGLDGKIKPGPADSSIFSAENGNCIAFDMAKPIRLPNGEMHKGVEWLPADKRPGSRKTGWEQMRKVMKAAHPVPGKPRENPGLFVFDICEQFIRTVPTLPRSEKDMDDVDTKVEDHIGDEARYRVRTMGQNVGQTMTTGHF